MCDCAAFSGGQESWHRAAHQGIDFLHGIHGPVHGSASIPADSGPEEREKLEFCRATGALLPANPVQGPGNKTPSKHSRKASHKNSLDDSPENLRPGKIENNCLVVDLKGPAEWSDL